MPAPSLIVAISHADILLDDHFEIPLVDLPGDGSDVEDEIDVEFADTIPACAFDIDFATMKDGEVSDYVSVLQVLDDKVSPPAPLDLVTRGPGGVQQDAAADTQLLAVSADGRYAAFTSAAGKLAAAG